MKLSTRFFSFAIVSAIGLVSSSANATNLYSTNFNSPTYADGGLIGQDGWLITGASVVSPIAVANTATNGNVTLTTTGQDVNRPFTPAVTSGSIYLSADINVASAATGDYFLHLSDGGTSAFFDRVFVKSSGANTFVMALGTSSQTAPNPVYGTTNLNIGQTYHIVAEYDFVSGATNDTGALYIDPVDPIFGDTPASPSFYVAATTNGADATTISAVNFRQGTTGSAAGATVDNINVAVPVPEPTTLALAGMGLIGSIGFIRRRKN